jgi:hypothetical protein
MRWLANLLARICLASLAVISLAPATRAAAPPVPACSWPFESTGRGLTNLATPDTNATYWVMPVDTGLWGAVVVQGAYPAARFFGFSSYKATGALIDTTYDSHIVPDPGSTNPFAAPAGNGPHNYTLTIGASALGSANLLSAAGSRLAFVVYRVYVPDQGLDRTGGVGVPAVSLVGRDGSVRRLQPCPFASAETSLGNMATLLLASGFSDAADFLQNILTAALHRQVSITGNCNASQPGPAAVPFGAAPGENFFPNPQTTYLHTPNLCLQPGKVVLIRGRAFVFPNTYLGGSVFQPAFDDQVQVRYWSMCNNDGVIPSPVIACQADFQTRLGQDQFYTYVVSNDPAPPSWLPADATWLPWGPTNAPITLIFRSILPENSTIAGDYHPTGVFCDQELFVAQGWQACFEAAGVSAATGPQP